MSSLESYLNVCVYIYIMYISFHRRKNVDISYKHVTKISEDVVVTGKEVPSVTRHHMCATHYNVSCRNKMAPPIQAKPVLRKTGPIELWKFRVLHIYSTRLAICNISFTLTYRGVIEWFIILMEELELESHLRREVLNPLNELIRGDPD